MHQHDKAGDFVYESQENEAGTKESIENCDLPLAVCVKCNGKVERKVVNRGNLH